MAKKIELLMPKVGESINEATVLQWLKAEGDQVEIDEPVLEIATDKVDTEVPSPVNGTIKKLLCGKDDVIGVGKPLAIIETSDEVSPEIPVVEDDGSTDSAKQEAPAKSEASQPAEPAQEATSVKQPVSEADSQAKVQSDRFYSPLVLNIARKENISFDELEKLPGSGKNGRVTKKDILAYVDNRGEMPEKQPEKAKVAESTQASQKSTVLSGTAPTDDNTAKYREVQVNPGDEVVEMERMRKLISEHMVASKKISPHVTSFVEADVTNIVHWRNKNKGIFMKREGEKLTFTPVFIDAIAKALKDYPLVNVSVSGDQIIKRKGIHIGMAAALPSGQLIVPVIRNADHKSLTGLTKEVNDFANRARNNQLKPDEIQGGTFTLTNVGTFGNLMGTPIIMQPQVAILATGAIQKKPAVIETESGDAIGIRHKMFLSHSYDHRVVDGALGGAFVKRVADYLEAFDPETKI